MSFWKNYIPDFSQPENANKKFTFLKMPVSEEVSDKHFQKYYLDVERDEYDTKFITKVMNECNLEPVEKLSEIVQVRVTTANKLLDMSTTYFEKVETFDKNSATEFLNQIKDYLGEAAEFAFKFKIYTSIHMTLGLGDKETVIDCIGNIMWINRMYSYFVTAVQFIERRFSLTETVWE